MAAEHRDRLVEAVLAPPLVQGHGGAAGAWFERADAVTDRHRQRRERFGVERIELGRRGVEVVEAELTGAGAGLAYPSGPSVTATSPMARLSVIAIRT